MTTHFQWMRLPVRRAMRSACSVKIRATPVPTVPRPIKPTETCSMSRNGLAGLPMIDPTRRLVVEISCRQCKVSRARGNRKPSDGSGRKQVGSPVRRGGWGAAT